jgi:hypothetical protein
MQGKPQLIGKFSWFWVYYFSDSGILQYRTMSHRKAFALLFLGVGVAFVFSIFMVFLMTVYNVVPLTVGYLSILFSFFAAMGTPIIYSSLKTRRLSRMPFEQITMSKSATSIPWSDVISVELRKGSMKVETDSGSYRVSMTQSDAEVESFLDPIVGDRLEVI